MLRPPFFLPLPLLSSATRIEASTDQRWGAAGMPTAARRESSSEREGTMQPAEVRASAEATRRSFISVWGMLYPTVYQVSSDAFLFFFFVLNPTVQFVESSVESFANVSDSRSF